MNSTIQHCESCGGARHIRHGDCPRDLHGEDVFKTACAVCETVIPSGGSRVGDKYGNLYCDVECMNRGYETLIERMETDRSATGANSTVADGQS